MQQFQVEISHSNISYAPQNNNNNNSQMLKLVFTKLN